MRGRSGSVARRLNLESATTASRLQGDTCRESRPIVTRPRSANSVQIFSGRRQMRHKTGSQFHAVLATERFIVSFFPPLQPPAVIVIDNH